MLIENGYISCHFYTSSILQKQSLKKLVNPRYEVLVHGHLSSNICIKLKSPCIVFVSPLASFGK